MSDLEQAKAFVWLLIVLACAGFISLVALLIYVASWWVSESHDQHTKESDDGHTD